MSPFLTFILFFISTLSFAGPTQLCALVDHHAYVSKDIYDNGYKESRYHQVLDTVEKIYSKKIHKMKKGSFHIKRDWSDGAVNAWAWFWGSEYWIEVPGGMARYHLINEEAFIATICHELGHLLGGAPHSNEISFEGQADYYAPMKCMEEVLDHLGAQQSNDLVPECKGRFCDQRFAGIKSLTHYYAFLAGDEAPSLQNQDSTQVSQTIRTHPSAQCRFDIMVNSLRCSNRNEFSYSNTLDGACLDEEARRSRCFFKRK